MYLSQEFPRLWDQFEEQMNLKFLEGFQAGELSPSAAHPHPLSNLYDTVGWRDSLRGSIAQLQLERRKFTKKEIVDWVSRYKDGNINNPDYRREIIDTFVNSVFVYDDKLILTYNYKDGSQTLTLQEIEAALSSDLTGMCPPDQVKTMSLDLFLISSKACRLLKFTAITTALITHSWATTTFLTSCPLKSRHSANMVGYDCVI